MTQTTYEIRVSGVVPESDLDDLGAVTVSTQQALTVLYGVADQSALHGLLARLMSLGLEVVEVRQVVEPEPTPPQRTAQDE